MIEILTIIEIAAVILGLISVYLTTKQNIWCWPTGIAMVILYVIVFANARLYSDMIENVIYIFLQIYGWYYWVYGRKKASKELPVKRLSENQVLMWLVVIAFGTSVVGFIMNNFTNADFAYFDALTTIMSLVAQWLLGRKILESWVLWIIVDIISTTIYLLKGLYFTTGLYMIFLVLAIGGLIKWYKSYKKSQADLS